MRAARRRDRGDARLLRRRRVRPRRVHRRARRAGRRHRRSRHRARATCSWACLRLACTPTGTRWPAGSSSTSSGSASTAHVAELGCTVADALLATHRSYLPALGRCSTPPTTRPMVKGLAHITGGGITDNLPRILPEGVTARIQRAAWTVPPLFGFLQTWRQRSRRRHAAYLQHGHRDDRGVRAGDAESACARRCARPESQAPSSSAKPSPVRREVDLCCE